MYFLNFFNIKAQLGCVIKLNKKLKIKLLVFVPGMGVGGAELAANTFGWVAMF